MKEKIFNKIGFLIIAFIMIFSATVIVKNCFTEKEHVLNEINKVCFDLEKKYSSIEEDTDDLEFNYKKRAFLEEKINQWENDKEQKEQKEALKALEKKSKVVGEISKKLPKLIEQIQNIGDEDFDTVEFLDSILNTISGIAVCCGPYGMVVAAVAQGVNAVVKIIDGFLDNGSPSTTELQDFEQRLNQELKGIKEDLSNIEEQIDSLTNEINFASDKIIDNITSIINTSDNKERLDSFFNGEGFNYLQYKNFIRGKSKDNLMNATAYYSLYTYAEEENDYDLMKKYGDILYSSIMENRDILLKYILGDNKTDSIIRNYYDYLSANPEILGSSTSPEFEALLFANDLYQTEIEANSIMHDLNLYQMAYMLSNDEEKYVYLDSFVTKQQITGNDKIDCISKTNESRQISILEKIASEVGYILGLSDSYIVKEENGDIYEVTNKDKSSFGRVMPKQEIYLNNVPESVCEMLSIKEKYEYAVGNSSLKKLEYPVFSVDGEIERAVTTYGASKIEIASIDFVVDNLAGFNGGKGTKEEPYCISSVNQFNMIKNNMDAHYKLIRDLDFNGTSISPLGFDGVKNDNETYNCFNGTLDGSGHTIKNLIINGSETTGLFAEIGENGQVKNLNFYNIKVDVKIKNVNNIYNYYYAGIIAGKNNGIISNCSISSDMGKKELLDVEIFKHIYSNHQQGQNAIEYKYYKGNTHAAYVDDISGKNLPLDWNDTHNNFFPEYGVNLDIDCMEKNVNIFAFAGGLVGKNNNEITLCTIDYTKVYVSSKHDFGNNSCLKNTNEAYVGGICAENTGKISYSIVKGGNKIASYARSFCDISSEVSPYVKSMAGGITAKMDPAIIKTNLNNIFCDATVVKSQVYRKNNNSRGSNSTNCYACDDKYIPVYKSNSVNINIEEKLADITFINNYIEKQTKKKYVVEAMLQTDGEKEIEVTYNSEKVKFNYYGVYGIDYHMNDDEYKCPEATILVSILIGGENKYLLLKIDDCIMETIYPKEVVYENNSDDNAYEIEVTVNYYLAEPTKYILRYSLESGEKYGEKNVYAFDNKETLSFYLICDHEKNFVESDKFSLVIDKSFEATFETEGINIYKCSECGVEKEEIIPKKKCEEHNYITIVGKEATCCTEGYTESIICQDCKKVYKQAETIPESGHIFVCDSADAHYCTNCGKKEAHNFLITESIENVEEIDGELQGKLVYIYSCDSCDNSFCVEDNNTIVTEKSELPTIVVSDGYALSGGDKVVVYVQLLNFNQCLYSARLGIRFDERLVLDSYSNEKLDDFPIIGENDNIENGVNLMWANTEGFLVNGVLLKLTFIVPKEAKTSDIYDVRVVYSTIGDSNGGFVFVGDDQSTKRYSTISGKITMIEHLPGDVNNDNKADILDAFDICKYLLGNSDEKFLKKYADVNFDGIIGDLDVLYILKSVTGGYGLNLFPPDYTLYLDVACSLSELLNSNVESIYISSNEENQSGNNELIELEREGFLFLGWYTKLIGGEKVDSISSISYNSNQIKQTLYAHWERTRFIFDGNGANNNGAMEDISYLPSKTTCEIENNYALSKKIIFVTEENDEITMTMNYTLTGWGVKSSDGEIIKKYEPNDTIDLNQRIGKTRLFAIWEYLEQSCDIEKDIFTNLGGYESIWKTEEGKLLSNEKDIIISYFAKQKNSSNVYLREEKSPLEYFISFDLDGGEANGAFRFNNEEDKFSITKKYEFNLFSMDSTDFFTKTGYVFDGWKDNKGNIYSYKIEEIGYINNLFFSNETIIFTAQWKKPFTVSYNIQIGNDIIEVHSDAMVPNHEYKFYELDDEYLRGYIFECWMLESEEECKEIKSDTVLFAKMTPKECEIEFVFNEFNNVSYKYRNYYYNRTGYVIIHSISFYRKGYSLVGWSKDSEGVTSHFGRGLFPKDTIDGGKIQLYPVWKLDTEHEIVVENTYTINDNSESFANYSFDFGNYFEMEEIKKIYTSTTLTVSFDVKEIEKGYQEMFVYYILEGEAKKKKIFSRSDYEAGGSGNPSTDTFTETIEFDFVNISELIFHFEANGENDDTWELSNLKINITFQN